MIHRVSSPSRPEFRPGAQCARAVLFALVLGPWAFACTPVGMPSAEPEPVVTTIPSVEEGTLPPSSEEEARRILQEARDYLESGQPEQAVGRASVVIDRYPQSSGSGEALEILARASLAVEDFPAAANASERYLGLFGSTDQGYPEAALLAGEALAADGQPLIGLQALLSIPQGAPPEVQAQAIGLLRTLVPQITFSGLQELNLDSSMAPVFRGLLATELAVSLYLRGDKDEAVVWAERALEFGVQGEAAGFARGILDDNPEEVMGQPLVLGAILPQSGVSPGLMEYGEWVLEGIQIAVEEFQSELRRPIRLEVLDHEGLPSAARESVLRLEELGAVGSIAPFREDLLEEVASARSGSLPLVSPFASISDGAGTGVFSLSGPSPVSAEFVADYSWDLGLERIAILRPGDGGATSEAAAFSSAFEARGGSIVADIVYRSGATSFQGEFDRVGSLLPDGLFLPLTPRDIQLLAPQFTYYGLDTLGIQLLGTSGWTEDEVVQDVDSRHTDGVIASTTRLSQEETEAYRAFRLRYEDRFQRSLRSQIPAYGYDAAVVLLQALRSNPRNDREFLQAVEMIDDFPGATGHLTVDGGAIHRIPQLVRIQNHELIYISTHLH